jgi:hypothetical protein
MVILPQCRANLMIGNPGKTWGAFFRFSASSLQRMRSKQLAVSILVNASPLPSSSIHHQEVTFGTQFSGN